MSLFYAARQQVITSIDVELCRSQSLVPDIQRFFYSVQLPSFPFHIIKEVSEQANTNNIILTSVRAMLPQRQLVRKQSINQSFSLH